MVPVRFIRSMVPLAPHLPFHVRIGPIKTVLKIIHFTVSLLFFIFKLNHKIIQGWTTNPAERTMLAFSSVPTIQVRLPAGNDQTTLLHIVAVIRDRLDCIAERNLSSVAVLSDSEGLANLVATFQNKKNTKINNPILQTLSSGNQNLIGQIITSVSLEFNKINNQTIESAISSKMIQTFTYS